MIEVTRLNGKTFHVNALLIEQIQSHPDTTITLTNGKTYVVLEDEKLVVRKMIEYHQQVHTSSENYWRNEHCLQANPQKE
ncbi:flagellar FlbD family protein [Bacillaceae bacterium SIJ1]|uniref:flagellar FlbD family protein n=1 Tax=Litoribacterium kuwaitense TaxID=1398745 RepID=UPI0013E9FF47|nr:flagellar FlbD family protein [Litoribacterium kuwaitense]NGP44120.1 flagellar FlbD family protein [Litoribacterium kuwaitense]